MQKLFQLGKVSLHLDYIPFYFLSHSLWTFLIGADLRAPTKTLSIISTLNSVSFYTWISAFTCWFSLFSFPTNLPNCCCTYLVQIDESKSCLMKSFPNFGNVHGEHFAKDFAWFIQKSVQSRKVVECQTNKQRFPQPHRIQLGSVHMFFWNAPACGSFLIENRDFISLTQFHLQVNEFSFYYQISEEAKM